MGNVEAIEALNNGTKAWETYVQENGKPEILVGAVHDTDISGADLSGINGGSGLRFNRCEMNDTNFSRTSGEITIHDSNASGMKVQDADPSKFKLWGSNAPGLDLQGSNLEHFEIRDSQIPGANLQGTTAPDLGGDRTAFHVYGNTNMDRANLDGAVLPSSKFEHVSMQGASAKGAVLDNSRLHQVNATGADMQEASLNGVKALRTDFSEANMEGAKASTGPSKVILNGKEFEQIPKVADFAANKFDGTNLKGADFKDANLNKASMKGADLTNADVTGAVTSEMKVDGDTKMAGVKGLNQETLDKIEPEPEPKPVDREHASVGETPKGYVNEGGEPLLTSVDKAPDPSVDGVLSSANALDPTNPVLSGIFGNNSSYRVGDPDVAIVDPKVDVDAPPTPTVDIPPPELPAYAAADDYRPSDTMMG